MKVRDVMTKDVACCTPDTKLNQVARIMVEYDCGEVPVTNKQGVLIGVITDRDICCRAVAQDDHPRDISAGRIMSAPVVSARPDMALEDCAQLMEENMVRRIPVVDEDGCCCGIVALADIACKTQGTSADEIVHSVSRPSEAPSAVEGLPRRAD